MKLQILIPQYKEDENLIRGLLDSIELQQSIDKNEIGVIIVNDGSDVILSKEFLDRYSYKLEYLINEKNCGVSASRNIALDAATADYVMWCDADDIFCDMRAFFFIFNQIEENDFNILISAFLQETYDDKNGYYYVLRGQHTKDTVFVHGKVFKRQWLIDNDIKWNPALRIHEDHYFNCLAQDLCPVDKTVHCTDAFYMWRHNANSVCRRDDNYIPHTYVNMLDSNDALIENLMARGRLADAQKTIAVMIYQTFYELNTAAIWETSENVEWKNITEQRFKDYYNKYEDLFNLIDDDIKASTLLGCKKDRPDGKKIQNFSSWIEYIKNKK